MAPHFLDPSARPDPERDERLRASTARIELRPATRVAHLATRSLACPSCRMPLALATPVGWGEELACAFCEEVAPAAAYLQRRGWPEVDVIARLD
jgi:hypothetical protein